MDTVMKRAIFAVIFCLAAVSPAAAADDALAGLIQAGNRDAALKMIAAGTRGKPAHGGGTTPPHRAAFQVAVGLSPAPLPPLATPHVIDKYGIQPLRSRR